MRANHGASAFAATAMLIGVFVAGVYAPERAIGAAPDTAPITITDTVIVRSVDPGETLTVSVVVKNQTSRAFDFVAEPADLARQDDDATAVGDAPAGTTRRGAGAWVTPLPDQWRLAPRTERSLALRLNIPADARPGGRFATVLVRAIPVDGDGAVRLTTEIPIVVLLTVEGKFERDVQVAVDGAPRVDWTGGQMTWHVEVRNEGDVHENLSGTLRMDGLVGASRSTRLPSGILLPGEHRTYPVSMEVRSAPDVIEATATLTRDGAGVVRGRSDRTLVLPWWLLAAIAGCAVVVRWRVVRRRA